MNGLEGDIRYMWEAWFFFPMRLTPSADCKGLYNEICFLFFMFCFPFEYIKPSFELLTPFCLP